MRRAVMIAMAAVFLNIVIYPKVAEAGPTGYYEVYGVKGEDMLKMRAGPGIGYKVIVGLPNGTLLRVNSCEQIGGTRWCKVFLKQARGLRGYVSWTYLRENFSSQ